MGPQIYIQNYIRSVVEMVRNKQTFNVRVSPINLERIDKLIPTKYASRSDFANTSIIELLQREDLEQIIEAKIEAQVNERIEAYLSSPAGQELIKKKLDEYSK